QLQEQGLFDGRVRKPAADQGRALREYVRHIPPDDAPDEHCRCRTVCACRGPAAAAAKGRRASM
ncbi:hypothetical protein GGF44_000399, partial [Coemansia sp. RSA 1694]